MTIVTMHAHCSQEVTCWMQNFQFTGLALRKMKQINELTYISIPICGRCGYPKNNEIYNKFFCVKGDPWTLWNSKATVLMDV